MATRRRFQPLIVGIGGTLRRGSSTERVLNLALRHAERSGARAELFAGPDIAFSHYDPTVGTRCDLSKRFCELLRAADGIIVASPCYHGSVSGLVKNALDYVEEMRNDQRPYFDGRSVGCIGCGSGNQGPSMVVTELRAIIHALRGWCVPLAVAINTPQVMVSDLSCSDDHIDEQLRIMVGQVIDFAHMARYGAIQTKAVTA
jgi:FMN reductase